MTEIVFSFDTEDYVNPHAADGIINSAHILREAGIKGCYNVVGMLAEALEEWGRDDIIKELSEHQHHQPDDEQTCHRNDHRGEDLGEKTGADIQKPRGHLCFADLFDDIHFSASLSVDTVIIRKILL